MDSRIDMKQYINRIFSWDDRNLFLRLWIKFLTYPNFEYTPILCLDVLQKIFHSDIYLKCRYVDPIPNSIFIDPISIDYYEKLKPHSIFLKDLVFRRLGENNNHFNPEISYDVYSLGVLTSTDYISQKLKINRLDNFFERMSNMMMNYMIFRKKYMKFNIGIWDKEVFLRITSLYNI